MSISANFTHAFASDKCYYDALFPLFRELLSNSADVDNLMTEWNQLKICKENSTALSITFLADRFMLSKREEFAIALAFATVMDVDIALLIKKNDNALTFLFAMRLYDTLEKAQDLFAVTFSLGFQRMMANKITVTDGALNLSMTAIRLLCGFLPEIDACTCKLYENMPPMLYVAELQEKLILCLQHANSATPVMVWLEGEKGSGKTFQMQKLSEQSKIPLLTIDADKLPESNVELSETLTSIHILLAVAPAIVCLCGYSDKSHLRRVVNELQSSAPFFCITVTDEVRLPELPADVLPLTYKVPPLTRTQRRELWENTLQSEGISTTFDLRHLSNQYKLAFGGIQKAAHALRRRADMGLPCDESTLREIVENAVHEGIGSGLAKLIRPKFSMGDIILPDELMNSLREICSRVRNEDLVMEQWGFTEKYPYGYGMSVLFYGAPGTGKTMAAHVIASELQTPLYYVDFSKMIDKYIGETEKNILELFRQARKAGAILFFDEADALFAKRSEVGDATDRYANAQTACLLQCIEDYDGVVILATNLLSNFDEAFRRRMRFFLHFHHPDETARLAIWKSAFPIGAPVAEDVDFAKLARLELTAGIIKNAVLAAAFLGVKCDAISSAHIEQALKIEMQKDGMELQWN